MAAGSVFPRWLHLLSKCREILAASLPNETCKEGGVSLKENRVVVIRGLVIVAPCNPNEQMVFVPEPLDEAGNCLSHHLEVFEEVAVSRVVMGIEKKNPVLLTSRRHHLTVSV